MIKSISTLFLSIFLTTNAYAEKNMSECEDKKSNEIEYSQCLDRVKNAVDSELQTWVNNQTFLLEEVQMETGRGSALNMFKRSQTNFITFRENNCRWQYLALSPDPKANLAYKKCYINTTKTRIFELSQIELK